MPNVDAAVRDAALALHKRGELAAAENAYRRILVDNPEDGLTWHYLAVLCGQRSEHAGVVSASRKAISCGYETFSVFANLARALSAEDKPFEAAEAAQKNLGLSPTDLGAALEMIEILRKAGLERSRLMHCKASGGRAPINPNCWTCWQSARSRSGPRTRLTVLSPP